MGDAGRDERKFYTFDQLIRQRAVDEDQTPLFAYPRSRHGVTDFELIAGKELNRLVDRAASTFVRAGICPVVENTVVGLYSPSTLDYLINIYALGRLGYTSFLISPRLPAIAVASLLEKTEAHIFIHAEEHEVLATQCRELVSYPLNTLSILSRSEFDTPDSAIPVPARDVDPLKERHRLYIMLHSSGSTGLPKPISYTNARLLVSCLTSPSLVAFQSLPIFHAHGLVTYSQAIWSRKTIYLFNGYTPQTNRTLTEAINTAKPEIVWTVPYVLKLLAESEDGIEALKRCQIVSSSGSRCPDELGDMLTDKGVFLGCLFGSTEVSQLFTSISRPRNDKAWNYLRTLPHVIPYLLMRPIEESSEICECIVLDGHRAKSISNSSDPPDSFHTSDLFIAHPSIPHAWKFIGRADDRVTLLNGEKVLPLPIEGRIVQNPLVREAIVFGVDQAVPGLLLFRTGDGKVEHLSNEDFVDRVWSTIQDANSKAESFSHIGREMVVVLSADVKFPCTDKGTFKRAQVYRQFEQVIKEAYVHLESSRENKGTLILEIPELETWLVSEFKRLGVEIDAKSDFFAAGVDSLKAIQVRGLIIKNLDLGKDAAKLGSMIVYDAGNIGRLARILYEIRVGDLKEDGDDVAEMEYMIAKYSLLPERAVKTQGSSRVAVVILTGVTGFLGSHILAELLNSPHVSKVFCLIRSPNSDPESRLASSLKDHSFSDLISSPKLVPLSTSLPEHNLGLSKTVYDAISHEVTHLIHCAWPVNFSISLTSFEPQFLALQNLLSLTRTAEAQLIFCSSISAALSTQPPDTIPSAPLDSLHQASSTGYGKSKLVAEKIIQRGAEDYGVRCTILRIGQIVPSRVVGKNKLWNPNETIPLVVRSANIIGCLPDRVGGGGCEWLEVQVVTKLVVDVCGFDAEVRINRDEVDKRLVYNVVHPKSFSWYENFLPLLRNAGMVFETVEYSQWLYQLRHSELDVEKNPSRKLLEFWEMGKTKNESQGDIKFDTGPAEDLSVALRAAPRIVDGNLVREFVEAWKKIW